MDMKKKLQQMEENTFCTRSILVKLDTHWLDSEDDEEEKSVESRQKKRKEKEMIFNLFIFHPNYLSRLVLDANSIQNERKENPPFFPLSV